MSERVSKIMIAVSLLTSVVAGAFTAWRMSVIDDSAGDSVNDAMHALITDASASIRAGNDVYDRMRAYADYRVAQNAQEATLAQAGASTDPEAKALLEQQAQDDGVPATVARTYFNQRFAKRDGAYNVAADRRSTYNSIVGRRSTDWAAFLADSRSSWGKTDLLVLLLIGYATVLLIATLSEGFAPTAATITSVLGTVVSIALAVLTILIEAGRLA